MKRLPFCALLAAILAVSGAPSAMAQALEPYLGQTILVGFNFCPRNWVPADGRLLPISQYTALFALYGTTFGGNGTTTFGLPDLQGRTPLGQGQGPGLPDAPVGEALGAPSTTLTISQMPAHSHALMASTSGPVVGTPAGNLLGTFPPASPLYTDQGTLTQQMNPTVISTTGSAIPFSQYQPTLTLQYCISMSGVFPSRP